MTGRANSLRVLALEPYYAGSHRAFLDNWCKASRHAWTLETLPARHWKWRMRGSALWFAEHLAGAPAGRFDLLFTCDLTAVADLRALLPRGLRELPLVCYFHENQLTYPLSPDDRRDYQYAFTNLTSALAADAVWFNSAYHRDAFLTAAAGLLREMPDALPGGAIAAVARRALVHYPAVAAPAGGEDGPAHEISSRPAGAPLRILWCHRWEFDKNPQAFFEVLGRLAATGAAFEVVLVGEQFRTAPAAFSAGIAGLGARVIHAGYVADRGEYERWLRSCDVVVSTAIQENFGIAVLEAMLAGCVPLLPNRLSYPEILPAWAHDACVYADDEALLRKLRELAGSPRSSWRLDRGRLESEIRARFEIGHQVPRLDDGLSALVRDHQPR